jgi:putative tryptophan/tyrosine transport system substrate-binding protein
MNNRREFITLLGGAAVMWPQEVLSEGHNRPPVIAWLWFGSPGGRLPERYGKAFAQGMRERGYTQGQDFILAYRYAEGRADRMPGLVAELLELGPDVFIAPTTFQASQRVGLQQRFLLSFLFSRTRSGAGLWRARLVPGAM